MELVIGSTTRPLNALSFAEACEHIAKAGYTDVAVFAHDGVIPVNTESSAAQIVATKKAAAQAGRRQPIHVARQSNVGTRSRWRSRCV